MKRKTLLTVLSVFLIGTISATGTLAYLTDRDSAVNTFTIGRVGIKLDEADVDENGEPIVDDEGKPVERVTENNYHLVPGKTYTKDPTITVEKKSEESYIRMMVEINCLKELDAIFADEGANLTEIFGGYDPTTWIYTDETRNEAENTITYEFRYKEPVAGGDEDIVLDALFDTFTLPGSITIEELEEIQELTITLEGHAIQKVGFEANAATGESAEDLAWKAFDEQIADQ